MSSDKAPEKLVRVTDGFETNYEELDLAVKVPQVSRDAGAVVYIREDLINKDAGYEDYLKERTAYEEQQEKEAIAKAERRREMFEKVALVKIKDGFGYSSHEVAQMADWIMADSDKFARGEE